MVVSDADNDWIDNTMLDDAIEETTAPGPSNGTLYIPEFVTEHIHDGMTKEEMLAAHALFLKKKLANSRPDSRNPQALSPKRGHLCRYRPKEYGVIQRSQSQVVSSKLCICLL
jgi:hypothetical protein